MCFTQAQGIQFLIDVNVAEDALLVKQDLGREAGGIPLGSCLPIREHRGEESVCVDEV